jgi:N-acetylmuramoyl-L-alanine amidase
MAVYILNAGHTLQGGGTGAVGYLNEAEEARKVVNALKTYLRNKGHTVAVVNVDKANTQTEYLQAVVKEANKHGNAALFVSIHFNAGGGRGSECYTWRGRNVPAAVGMCEEMHKLGFRNRGVKNGSDLFVIRKTKMETVLFEVAFVDNQLDYDLYKKIGVPAIAQAIARGILNY